MLLTGMGILIGARTQITAAIIFLFYAYATYWMSVVIGGSFIATLPAGALVFLPLDSVKILVTCWIGRKLQTYLENAASLRRWARLPLRWESS